ncbi:hypothetical protein RclHR1_00030024 [Rhizophagus clarus]|uniref:Uncharacterized protein n=1 Tax=Rhizophagus clarus TaxID=94130 RepID=A0A2Z6R518_9GLOM|nr:hypothetical protein RclHR1_00030024 [Rhizophagus clarus]GES92288.1 hypothetical protein GLOIN_2v1773299 [Rhizophagus clarus]
MHTRQLRNTESTRPMLNNLFNQFNFENIYQLPYNNNAQILAILSRRRASRRIQRLTGRILMRRNVEREAHRLQVHSRYIINLATDYIWNLHSTPSQRYQFTNLANNVNNINQNRASRVRRIDNTSTLDNIIRINNTQVTNNSFENEFFNGTNFDDNNTFESLILPAGFLGSSSFI